MLTEQRKRHILEILARDRRIVAKSLSQELRLSDDTIRRDLRELAAEGLLQRVYGGALPASPTIATLDRRRSMSLEAKQRLGRAAATLVEPDMVVIVDGGTTHLELVRNLPLSLRATIITHSPIIAAALEFHTQMEVLVIGGKLFRHSMVATGAAAIEAIARVSADLFFLGVTGVHCEEGFTTGDYEEAHVKRALMRRAAETVVIATDEKLGAVSAHVIAPVIEAGCLVIEAPASEAIRECASQANIRIIHP